jgi:hypothetical protein
MRQRERHSFPLRPSVLRWHSIAVAVAVSLTAGPIMAAPAKKSPVGKRVAAAAPREPAVCSSLRTDYEDASKKLALNQAHENIDNSAIRATMRQSEDNNVLAQARITMDLMKNNGCKSPTYAPSASRYALSSLKCSAVLEELRAREAIDRLNRTYTPRQSTSECDISTWKADFDQ